MKIFFALLVIFTSLNANGQNLKSELTLHYAFNNNTFDEINSQNNGTSNQIQYCPDENKQGKAAACFSGNSFISIPQSSINGMYQFSIVAKLKINSLNRQHCIIDKTETGKINYFQLIIDENNRLRIIFNNNYYRGNTPLTSNKYYQIVCSYNGRAIQLYINNELDGEFSCTGAIANANRDVFIGKVDNNTAYFDGTIDEFSIYKTSLSNNDILALSTKADNKINEVKTPSKIPTSKESKSVAKTTSTTKKSINLKEEDKNDYYDMFGMPLLKGRELNMQVFNVKSEIAPTYVKIISAAKLNDLLYLKMNVKGNGSIPCPEKESAWKIIDKATDQVIPLYSTNGFGCSASIFPDTVNGKTVIVSFKIEKEIPSNFDLVERDTISDGNRWWNFRNVTLTSSNNMETVKNFFKDATLNYFTKGDKLNDLEQKWTNVFTNQVIDIPSYINDKNFTSIIWDGDFKNKMADGKGYILFTYYEKIVSAIECEFIEGKINGVARYFVDENNGLRLSSNLSNLVFTNGVLTSAKMVMDDYVYEGQTYGRLSEGQGKWVKTDGSWHEGFFKNGEENGIGTLRLPDGKRYTGNFTDGVPNGHFTVKEWTLGGLYSNTWEADYVMGKLGTSEQTGNSLDRLSSGRGSSTSNRSSSTSNESSNSASNSSGSNPELVEIIIERDGKNCCQSKSEAYCFLVYEDGKKQGGGKTISKESNGDWYTDCGNAASWKVCGSNSYTEALKEYYRKKFKKEPNKFKISN